MWRKGNTFALLVEMQTGAATVESSVGITSKNEKWICLLTQQTHFWELSKGTQNTNPKEHKHPYVHCSIIYNHQDMEAAQVSISR